MTSNTRIFNTYFRYVLVIQDKRRDKIRLDVEMRVRTGERLIGLRHKPKKIPGGFMTKHGSRITRKLCTVKLINNDINELKDIYFD